MKKSADMRFMLWLAHFCSPFGTEVARVSTVIARLSRRGFLARNGKRVILTGLGWQALIEDGYDPANDVPNGLKKLATIKAKS